jgi:hypothetical protein
LGLPLIWLYTTSIHGTGMWVAMVGLSIIGVIWLTKLLGRLEDVGWLSSSWLGYFAVAIVLLNRIRRNIDGAGQPLQFHGLSLSDAAHSALSAMPWLKSVNGYEMLALFLLIQAPLALLPSKQRGKEAPSPKKFESRFGKLLAERRRTQKRFLVTPSAFLNRLLVIALFWVPLIYLDAFSRGGFGTWLARSGYFILIYAWLMNVQGRFEEAGWIEGWYGAQFCLVVIVASLMPLAVNWVNAYVALAIFVLIQVPAVFLLRKSPSGAPPTGGPPLSGSGHEVSRS